MDVPDRTREYERLVWGPKDRFKGMEFEDEKKGLDHVTSQRILNRKIAGVSISLIGILSLVLNIALIIVLVIYLIGGLNRIWETPEDDGTQTDGSDDDDDYPYPSPEIDPSSPVAKVFQAVISILCIGIFGIPILLILCSGILPLIFIKAGNDMRRGVKRNFVTIAIVILSICLLCGIFPIIFVIGLLFSIPILYVAIPAFTLMFMTGLFFPYSLYRSWNTFSAPKEGMSSSKTAVPVGSKDGLEPN